MATKKKKGKPQHPPAVPIGELVRRAEEKLQGGEFDEAIRLLQRADADVRQGAAASSSKGAPLPAHLAEARPRIARLLPRAFFERALGSDDPRRRHDDLEEAAKRAPSEARYLLALGAYRAARGDMSGAYEQLRRAHQIAPEDRLVERGYALGLLAIGHTHEFDEWRGRIPEARHDAPVQRLATLRDLIAGDLPLGSVPSPGGPSLTPGRGAGTASPASRTAPRDGALADQLLDSLSSLARGGVERAREQLSALPAFDHSPSRTEAAVFATQLFYSGALRFQAGATKDAATEFREAQRLASAHTLFLPWRERLVPYYHRIAEAALQEMDLSLAVTCWQAILDLDPRDVAAVANLESVRRIRASQAWSAERWEEAIQLWHESLAAAPEDEGLMRALAIGHEKAGHATQAISVWRTLAQRWRQRAKDRAADAQFKERLLRLEHHLVGLMVSATERPAYEIQNEMDAALKLDPGNTELRKMAAQLSLEFGRPQQAIKHLEALERHHGESADLLVLKGFALGMLGRTEAGERCFEHALELDPSHVAARAAYLLVLGVALETAWEEDDLEEVVEICQRQLEIDPSYSPALSHLADAYFELGEVAEGKKTLARLIDLDPNSPQHHVTAGEIYLTNGRTREGEAEFKRAIEIEPSEACYFHIGEAYLRAGKPKKALQSFDRAIRLGSVVTILATVRSLFDEEHFQEAERYIAQALKQAPDHPEAHLYRGIYLMGERKMEEAEPEFTTAARLASEQGGFEAVLETVREVRREYHRISEMAELMQALEDAPLDMPLPRDLKRRLAQLEKQL